MQIFYDCGIDLGTTNSCLAVPDNDYEYVIIENQTDSMQVTPSAVSYKKGGRLITGQRAYNSGDTEDLAIQFKREMGTDKIYYFPSADVEKTAEDLSSEILKSMKQDANSRLDKRIENVVITVPAAFTTIQCEATKRAAELAGFKHILLLQEPIAAAVAYGARSNVRNKNWMVFDYGGGTLDVSIITTTEDTLTVANSEGDPYFGGCDIDQLMYRNIILPRLREEGYAVDRLLNENTAEGRTHVRNIELLCENCKKRLSTEGLVVFELFDLEDDNGKDIEFECTITREEFEGLISDTVDKAIETAKKALEGSGLTADKLDKILLVGGSTFIPLVRKRLEEAFGVELDITINPMTVVAAGASLYASANPLEVEDTVDLTDEDHMVISLTYDSVTAEESAHVSGVVTKYKSLDQCSLRIDSSDKTDFAGVYWTSGWINFTDTDHFDIDVSLIPGKMNYFKVFIRDGAGNEVVVENPYFTIRNINNGLAPSAPPANASISVEAIDEETGLSVLYCMIKKNTPLPASFDHTFRLTRDIDPEKDEYFKINIWEGENLENPRANHSAGIITVGGLGVKELNRIIPSGTDVDITIQLTESREILVKAYIPDFDYQIEPQTLRSAYRDNVEEQLEQADKRLKQAFVNIARLKRQNKDVSALDQVLAAVNALFERAMDGTETDSKTVNEVLKELAQLENDIIEKKQESLEDIQNAWEAYEVKPQDETNKILAEARYKVDRYGTEEASARLKELEKACTSADSDEKKKDVLNEIEKLGFEAMTTNFEWLEGYYISVLADCKDGFKNPQNAEFWKLQASIACDTKDPERLRKAIFSLQELLVTSSNQTFAGYHVDLMV